MQRVQGDLTLPPRLAGVDSCRVAVAAEVAATVPLAAELKYSRTPRAWTSTIICNGCISL